MSAWADLGLPCPSRDGYGYTRDMGLLRTPFATPQPEQRQAQTHLALTFTVSWLLNGEQLAIAEPYLLAHGYTGIELDLISGASPAGTPTPHAVRLIADYEVTAIRPGLYRLAIQAETPVAITTTCQPATCDVVDPDDQRCTPTPDPIQLTDTLAVQGGIVSGARERVIVTVASGLYPVEVDDQLTATAMLVNGFQLANQIESFQPSAQLTSGDVIDILVPVEFTQYPEAFQPAAQLLAGLVYGVYTPVAFSQYPEAFQPAAQLLSGTVIDEPGNVLVRNPDETMTSTAWLVDGTLE